MPDVTGFNEYNIKLDSVIGNDTRHTKKKERGGTRGWCDIHVIHITEKLLNIILGERVMHIERGGCLSSCIWIELGDIASSPWVIRELHSR